MQTSDSVEKAHNLWKPDRARRGRKRMLPRPFENTTFTSASRMACRSELRVEKDGRLELMQQVAPESHIQPSVVCEKKVLATPTESREDEELEVLLEAAATSWVPRGFHLPFPLPLPPIPPHPSQPNPCRPLLYLPSYRPGFRALYCGRVPQCHILFPLLDLSPARSRLRRLPSRRYDLPPALLPSVASRW